MKGAHRAMAQTILPTLFLMMGAITAWAQQSVPGTPFEYIEKTNDSTTLFFYTSVGAAEDPFELLDVTSRVSFNSTYPRGYNDGPVWKGKGLTFEVHGGLAGRLGKFSYQLMPVAYFSQNTRYELAPRNGSVNNENAYQYTSQVDWVQRYGNISYLFFHLGQSEIKFQSGKFITTLSTQNYSVGPSVFNPILLSQQGGGFPHLRIGSTPFDLWKIGKIEINALAGMLLESDYFDADDQNDQRIFNGLFIHYAPSFLKNFKIGIGKVLYKQTRYFELEDALALFTILEEDGREIDTGNDTFDQMAAMYVEWAFPEVGFRVYSEFAKNDFTGSIRWTLVEPEHTRGYTVGFEKTIKTKTEKEIKLIYEHTNLSINQAFLWRATPSFYAHGVNRQGYTHAGQLLGAGIGPGGNSDNLMVRLPTKQDGLLNFHFQRIENNRDHFVRNQTAQEVENHDIEYSLGMAYLKRLEKMEVFSDLTLSQNFNRYYTADKANLFLSVGVKVDLP